MTWRDWAAIAWGVPTILAFLWLIWRVELSNRSYPESVRRACSLRSFLFGYGDVDE